MTTVEAIKSILDEQVRSYKTLIDLLRSEKTCLLEFDAKGVETLSKEKDTLVLRIRLLEEERRRLIEKFCDENPQKGPFEGLTLQGLAGITGEDSFNDIRSKLVSLLQGIEELNGFNSILIERSLSYIRSNAMVLSSLGVGCGPEVKGALLSKEI